MPKSKELSTSAQSSIGRNYIHCHPIFSSLHLCSHGKKLQAFQNVEDLTSFNPVHHHIGLWHQAGRPSSCLGHPFGVVGWSKARKASSLLICWEIHKSLYLSITTCTKTRPIARYDTQMHRLSGYQWTSNTQIRSPRRPLGQSDTEGRYILCCPLQTVSTYLLNSLHSLVSTYAVLLRDRPTNQSRLPPIA